MKIEKQLSGVVPIIPTPFTKQEDIDEDALEQGCGLFAWLAFSELNKVV